MFLSGCNLQCKGCFNYDIWDYQYGKEFTQFTISEITNDFIKNPQLKGFSLLGGEPFFRTEKDNEWIIKLVSELKAVRPNISLWVWSGHLFENLVKVNSNKHLLEQFHVIVDGPFLESQKNIRLKYRGSSNQRVIDVQKSLNHQRIIEYKGDNF